MRASLPAVDQLVADCDCAVRTRPYSSAPAAVATTTCAASSIGAHDGIGPAAGPGSASLDPASGPRSPIDFCAAPQAAAADIARTQSAWRRMLTRPGDAA